MTLYVLRGNVNVLINGLSDNLCNSLISKQAKSADVTRSQWLKPTVPNNDVLKFRRHMASVLTFWTIPSVHGATTPNGPSPPRCRDFRITLRHTTVGRTPLDE